MFKIDHLSFHYTTQQELLKDLNFASDERVVGLIGKNGSGKSMLLKLISGELVADSGTISYEGRAYRTIYDLHYYKNFTLSELLDLLRELKSFSLENVEYYIAGLNLTTFIDKPLHTLSQGTYKKIGLLFSLLSTADLLLLDEPFESLDNHSTAFVAQIIKETQKHVIIVEHNHNLIEELCTAVINLDEGSL